MYPLHYFAIIFLFAINATAATIASIRNQQAPTVTYPVDFKLQLNEKVETLTKTSYSNFITMLRTKLGEGAENSSNVPILPNYGVKPVHLFDIVLSTSSHTVTVRCRRDNLYVRGYLMETNKWMEFTEADGLHMVDKDSEFLKFSGSYKDMENQAGKNVLVTNINYFRVELKKAVDSLALPAVTKDEKEKRGKALIVMAQMISESARFSQISAHFATGIATNLGVKLPDWMLTQLEQKWSQLSKPVQCNDKYNNDKQKEEYKYTPVTINSVVYNTAVRLRDGIFGVMLKETKISDPKTCGIKKLADEHEDDGEATVVLSADI